MAGLWSTGCAQPVLHLRDAAEQQIWAHQPKGFNVGTLDPAYHRRPYLAQVKAANGRLVRVFLRFHWDGAGTRYVLPRSTLTGLRECAAAAQALGLMLVLVGEFETAPNPPLWQDAGRAEAFVAAWGQLARDMQNVAGIAGYDLLNEPNPPWSDGSVRSARLEWGSLADRCMQAIRAQDATVPIVFEPIGGGQAIGFEGLQPFGRRGLVYSLHFYTPHGITHQGVGERWRHSIPYPATERDVPADSDAFPGPWNRARLDAALAPARRFQQRHGVPMFVGEFSCVRWAPGDSARRYVEDCVSLFADHGWSWCYHEFRGWPGWDAELVGPHRMHGTRRPDAPVMQVLQRALVAQSERRP